jgi:hypothetical protein
MLAVLALGAADARAAIGPGALVGGICTSNFVFRDATDLYLGTAAHCVEDLDGIANDPSEAERPNGCETLTLPLGTPIAIEGASAPGRLAYSSYLAMQQAKETDGGACTTNDFAIIRIDPRDHGAVDPTMPAWGGPTGLRRGAVANQETFLSFGRSDLRADVEQLKPREGYVYGTYPHGRRHNAWFMSPGLSGDSGSAVLDGAGGAVGVLVTQEYDGGNGVTNLAKALDYMRSHGGPDVRVVPGTAPFTGASIPTLVESPTSSPDPAPAAPPPPAQPAAPAPAAQPAAAAPAAAAPPAAAAKAAPAKAKPKPKARRCRRASSRRSARGGGKAPKCSRGKAAPRRR